MPVEPSAFPEEVQVAFFIYGHLSDRWDGTSGTYLGKDWTNVELFLKLYDVEDPKTIIFFMRLYEGLVLKKDGGRQKLYP